MASANIITGSNSVIIGDNGTYNSGTGIFGGNSTVEFTAAQNYTGTTTLAGGTLVVSNVDELAAQRSLLAASFLTGASCVIRVPTPRISPTASRLTVAAPSTLARTTSPLPRQWQQ